jgi:hypothetical protein
MNVLTSITSIEKSMYVSSYVACMHVGTHVCVPLSTSESAKYFFMIPGMNADTLIQSRNHALQFLAISTNNTKDAQIKFLKAKINNDNKIDL